MNLVETARLKELTVQQFAQEAFSNMVDHGFHDGPYDPGVLDRRLLLAVGELIEAQNEIRSGHTTAEIYYTAQKDGTLKPEGFGIELADAVLRIMDTAVSYGIDLAECMAEKHQFNVTRPRKHGKAF